jgi:regulatory protein
MNPRGGRATPVAAQRRSQGERRAAAEARRARRAEVTDPDVVMEAGAAFLAVRPRSMSETRRRLVALGYPAGLCDQVVARLVELGYLDDVAFAQAWVESRDRAHPRGSLALRQELARKGVAREVVDQVLEDREAVRRAASGLQDAARDAQSLAPAAAEADAAAAHRLLARREAALRRESDPRRQRQKAYALLARAGFSPDVCRAAAAAFGAVAEGNEDDA